LSACFFAILFEIWALTALLQDGLRTRRFLFCSHRDSRKAFGLQKTKKTRPVDLKNGSRLVELKLGGRTVPVKLEPCRS
jgi:hypothetical protein